MESLISMVLIAIIFFLSIGIKINCCYSTKVAYADSFTQSQLEFIDVEENYQLENCVPELIYIVLRHGSRYPSTSQIDKSKKFIDLVKEYWKSQPIRENISNRKILDEIQHTFNRELHYRLSELGGYEMRAIANRFAKRFPSLLNYFNMSDINIISSSKERSVESAQNFLKGLIGNNTEQLLESLITKINLDDHMMRLFDKCDSYLTQVKKNQAAMKEHDLFAESEVFQNLINNLKKRHDIEKLSLEPKLLIKLFTLCNIETAHRMPDNWCKIFVDEDYQIISYLNDLKQYWLKSYGNELNAKMVFILIQDMFTRMENRINNVDQNKVFLRFGHAENGIPLVTSLGLFHDEQKLLASNYEFNLKRKFKSGILSPFSSNMAFVLNKCSKDDNYKVSIFLNELPITHINAGKLACSEKNPNNNKLKLSGSVCDYSDLKAQLNKYIMSEYNEVCNLKQNDKPYPKNEL